MRKLVVVTAMALAVLAPAAHAADIGIGAFGGISIPIVNDLSEQGPQFGVRVPVNLVPLLTVEPYFNSSSLGDVDEDFDTPNTYTRDGGEVTGFGANVLLTMGGPGFKFFPFAGLGSHKIKRDGADDITDMAYNFGLGIGISPIPKLTLTLRGEFNMIATDETSVKFANVNAGLSYSLISLP
jgi:hypothetical protein